MGGINSCLGGGGYLCIERAETGGSGNGVRRGGV
jgi:hypothetical protein